MSSLITEKYMHYGFSQIEPLDSAGVESTRSLGGLSLQGFELLIFMLTYTGHAGEGRKAKGPIEWKNMNQSLEY